MHHYLNLVGNTFRMVQTGVTDVPFWDWHASPIGTAHAPASLAWMLNYRPLPKR